MRGLVLVAALALSGCLEDETVRAYGADNTLWVLSEIDGKAFAKRAELEFPSPDFVSGRAPCNSWSARQTAPYPWFKLGPVRSTKRMCPDHRFEEQFFGALSDMTESEVSGGVLVLRSETGREMVFKAETRG